MVLLSINLMISLSRSDANILALAALLALLALAGGALAEAGLGISRWFGLLMLIPGVNIFAFLAAGLKAHLRLTEARNELNFEHAKRMVAERDTEKPIKNSPLS